MKWVPTFFDFFDHAKISPIHVGILKYGHYLWWIFFQLGSSSNKVCPVSLKPLLFTSLFIWNLPTNLYSNGGYTYMNWGQNLFTINKVLLYILIMYIYIPCDVLNSGMKSLYRNIHLVSKPRIYNFLCSLVICWNNMKA